MANSERRFGADADQARLLFLYYIFMLLDQILLLHPFLPTLCNVLPLIVANFAAAPWSRILGSTSHANLHRRFAATAWSETLLAQYKLLGLHLCSLQDAVGNVRG